MPEATTEPTVKGWHGAAQASLKKTRNGSVVVGEVELDDVFEAIEERGEIHLIFVRGVWFKELTHVGDVEEKWESGARFTYPGVKFSATGTINFLDLALRQIRDVEIPGHEHLGEFSFTGDCAQCFNGTGRPCFHHDTHATYRISVTLGGVTYEIIENCRR